jgi:ABC-type multidrug transport system fused ATPase/permease subunit
MKEKKQNSFFLAISYSLENLKLYKISLALFIFLSVLISAINLGTVICIEKAVSAVGDKSFDIKSIIIVLVVFLLVGTTSTFLLGISTGKVGAKVANKIKSTYSKKIMNLCQEDRNQLTTGGVSSQFNYDLRVITDFIPTGMISTFKQTLMALIAIIYMLFVNWKLLIISIGFMPICMFIVNILRNKIGDGFRDNIDNVTKGNEVVSEVVRYIPVIKSFNLKEVMLNRVEVFYKGWLNSWIRIHKLFSPMLMINILINEFPKVLCITAGSYMALKNYISMEELISFVLLLDYVVEPLTTLPDLITNISNTGVACERIINILNLPDERQDGIDLVPNETEDTLLKFDNIYFGYDKNKYILKGLSFELKRGEKLALAGKSGSGKSSIISLLCGFYRSNEGKISMLGQDYNDLSLKSIRKQISLVSQDVYIFPMSVADNIALGSLEEHVSREQIIEAAKAANAHEFICQLQDGYDTILMENGKELSGGQRQMISVARAFLENSPIILLDEATSALDASAESVIVKSIDNLLKDRAAIIVSHRISSIKVADKILFIKDGKIIDEGSYDELMATETSFKSLFQNGLGTESWGEI